MFLELNIGHLKKKKKKNVVFRIWEIENLRLSNIIK